VSGGQILAAEEGKRSPSGSLARGSEAEEASQMRGVMLMAPEWAAGLQSTTESEAERFEGSAL